jgi:indolepyruvate ferredoxin oxidoreductase beta subunit
VAEGTPGTPEAAAGSHARASEVVNVLMVGVGGQGIVLASDLLAEAALIAGLDVKKSEIHGMSQRGGPVFSHVRFGPGRVQSPTIPQGEADVIYALERMELLRWAAWARPGGAACYFAQDMYPAGVSAYPEGLDEEIASRFGPVVRFDPRELRDRVSPKVKNTALLGAMSTLIPLDPGCYVAAMPRLCPPGTADVNAAAFELGRQLAQERLAARDGEPAIAG